MNSLTAAPLVTVVVPVFNQKADFLCQCIESILAQRYPNLEIIISDNHSDNGSWEIINGYAGDPRVRIIRPPIHLPMVQHWAFAVLQAKGELLSMMGSDDWAEPGWLETIIPEIVSYPGASFAFPNLTLLFEKGGNRQAARNPDIPTQLIPSTQAGQQVLEWTSHMFSWWIVGAIIRAKDYFAISGIARYATVHNGDYPLSLGLLTRGDALYVNKPLVNYRIWGEEEGKSDGRRQAVILEDMVRILACINTDPPVHSLCTRAGWSIGRIRRRFILLSLFWINLEQGRTGPTPEERKRILHSLAILFSARVTPAIFTAPIFSALKALLRVIHFGWKRVLKKLIPI
jgi:hypothetical protein